MPDLRTIMTIAELTNHERDAVDRRNGFAAPSDGPDDTTLRTVIQALTAGISTEDWDAVAEGTAMLGALAKYRPWQQVGK